MKKKALQLFICAVIVLYIFFVKSAMTARLVPERSLA